MILETVREYGWERLSEGGETDKAQKRHAAYYLSFAEKAEPNVARGLKGVWFDDAVFPTAGMLRDGSERPSFDRLVAEARGRLDAGAFAAGWEEKAQRCRLMKLSRRPLAIALPREILRQSKA
jgi:hypothetical protein